tara:strand:+ start:154 stop:333 length:180 start_codon:yes stop_codon:yes gene_type:complete
MTDMMKCKNCGVFGEDFDCPDVKATLCDDCYTVERVTLIHEQGLNDLFEVDSYLSKLGE